MWHDLPINGNKKKEKNVWPPVLTSHIISLPVPLFFFIMIAFEYPDMADTHDEKEAHKIIKCEDTES